MAYLPIQRSDSYEQCLGVRGTIACGALAVLGYSAWARESERGTGTAGPGSPAALAGQLQLDPSHWQRRAEAEA
eukprot:2253454-Rhodomonas_salina.1